MRTETLGLITILWLILLKTLSAGRTNRTAKLEWGWGRWEVLGRLRSSQVSKPETSFDFHSFQDTPIDF
jgi:hypothetical protein